MVSKEMTGTVTYIGRELNIIREGIPNLQKRMITLEEDDGQKSYLEIRGKFLSLIEKQKIETGTRVHINYIFQGSEKSGKKYNNILINNIKRL